MEVRSDGNTRVRHQFDWLLRLKRQCDMFNRKYTHPKMCMIHDSEDIYLLLLLERFLDRSYKPKTVRVCLEHPPALIQL